METLLELGITVFVLSGLGLALLLIVYGCWGLWQCWQLAPEDDQQPREYDDLPVSSYPVIDEPTVREAELIVEQYLYRLDRQIWRSHEDSI